MKFKDYFTKLKEQGKITNEEFDKFLETVPEGEIPDALYAILQDKFMTVDRAVTHKEVHGRIMRENLDPIDNDLKKMLTFIDGIDKFAASNIDKSPSTYSKLAAITETLPKLFEKVKTTPGDNEDAKKQIEESKKVINELTEKIKEINSGYEVEKKKLTEQYENREKSMKIDWALENKTRNYTLAESHEPLRDSITRIILSDLKSENALALGEKPGEIIVQEIVNGAPRPKFNGNDPVTIDSLLEAKFEPYIKKSNADDDARKQTQEPRVKSYQVDTNKQVRRGNSTTVQ